MRRLLVLATVIWAASVLHAQTPASATVWDGAYAADQAERGRTLYAAECAECHGGGLEGGEGKALSGMQFWNDWREQSVGDLLTYVSKNMPLGRGAGTLSPSTYADIVAHILRTNDLPAGPRQLTAASGATLRIVPKDGGGGELPPNTLARVVGCLAPRAADGSWRVVKATRPERTTTTAAAPAAATPLGEREYALKFVLRSLASMVGQRVAVTGLLMGDGGADGLNVSTVTAIAGSCD
jgi:S-disulfanyl-L-cysteine oxidoreductase SoxD